MPRVFVGDVKKNLPLPNKSIDIIISRHALEPNGGYLKECLDSLFRVSRNKVILFEPHYERANSEGKKRFNRHGYIKNIKKTINICGGILEEIFPLQVNYNKLNPISCFIITPPNTIKTQSQKPQFSIPGTNYLLKKKSNFYLSQETGFVFPVLEKIPLLNINHAILARSFCSKSNNSKNNHNIFKEP